MLASVQGQICRIAACKPAARNTCREALTLWHHLRVRHRVTRINDILARLSCPPD